MWKIGFVQDLPIRRYNERDYIVKDFANKLIIMRSRQIYVRFIDGISLYGRYIGVHVKAVGILTLAM